MLNELRTSLLNSEEIRTVSERIRALVIGKVAEMPLIGRLSQLIVADIEGLGEALNRSRGSEFTALLQEKDSQRDAAFIAFRDYVKACSNRTAPELAAAGKLLTDIIKRHGWTLYAKGYTEESASLVTLVDELKDTEAAAAIQALNATGWVEELKNAQAAFEDTYNNKVTTEAQEDFPLVHQTRAQLSRRISTLLDCVRILVETDEAGKHDELVGQLNEVITDVMSRARARRTRDDKPSGQAEPE